MTTGLRHPIDGLAPRLARGTLEVPVDSVRGGTSTGVVLPDDHLPRSTALRDEVIRKFASVPLSGELSGNRRISEIGRSISTGNRDVVLFPHHRDRSAPGSVN